MPLYEYKCDACGTVFEIIQKFSDAPLEIHAECGGKLERLMGTPALHFKGSGFYVNDYAKKSGATAPAANGKPAASDSSASSSSTSATPAASTTGGTASGGISSGPTPSTSSTSNDKK